ncbi:serpin (serine protease inhibitor) domain-containing protein [Ditylenchus destructor]|uniref:Serpin (Serine protease inhibitor) domain-containing protein n=1 Tax=Ditylenchus destructor TaxID=166010 RepID=A0AAD4MTN1_9BILA|nr:serpin (serine protease inhibitor) domain-containing protein [Ditylenchus destructor]
MGPHWKAQSDHCAPYKGHGRFRMRTASKKSGHSNNWQSLSLNAHLNTRPVNNGNTGARQCSRVALVILYMYQMTLIGTTRRWLRRILNHFASRTLKNRAMIEANNDFAAKLMREFLGTESLCISPISISFVLAMSLAGAMGETEAEILKLLGKGCSLDEIEAFFAEIKALFQQLSELEILHDANRIYYDLSLEILGTYKEKVKRLYGEDAFDLLDFKDSDATAKLSGIGCGPSIPQKVIKKKFHANRPFLYAIVSRKQHVLFIGTVTDVEEKNESEFKKKKT